MNNDNKAIELQLLLWFAFFFAAVLDGDFFAISGKWPNNKINSFGNDTRGGRKQDGFMDSAGRISAGALLLKVRQIMVCETKADRLVRLIDI